MGADIKAVLDYVTLGIAVFGAVLSVVNTWLVWHPQRTRLRVVPKVARVNGQSLRLCVEVTNLSGHEVRMSMLCLCIRGNPVRLALKPERVPGDEMGDSLMPRASVTLFIPDGARKHEQFGRINFVEIKTACGHTFRGRSPALRWYVKHRPAAVKANEIERLGDGWGLLVTSPYGPPKSTVEPIQH